MFDKKLYLDTFSQVHAPEETLSEVLKMTDKKNKNNVVRVTRILMFAAIITVMLATTVFAYVGFTRYENPMQMLRTFFGNEEYHIDKGGFMGTETYYDLHWDVVYPTIEQIPMDEQLAEEQVAPYISDVGNSITDNGDTLTVQAHLYDSATDCGIIYMTLENPGGVHGYNLQWNGEVTWTGLERVVAHNCWGKNFIIEEETTDTKLSIAHYYSGLYGDENCIQVGFGGGKDFLMLPLTDGGGMEAASLADGDICVSAIGIRIRADDMEFLRKTDTDGTLLPPCVDNIKSLIIRYQDGSEYVVHMNTKEHQTENYKYCIGTMEGTERTYSFNRLIGVEKIEAVIINDVEFSDIDNLPPEQRNQEPVSATPIVTATEPALP